MGKYDHLFNKKQLAHMRELQAHPEKVCACGWYWKNECARRCHNPTKRDAAADSEPVVEE